MNVEIKFPARCSNCGSDDFEYVVPPQGESSFVLTSINQSVNPPVFNSRSGLPVFVFACKNCGTLTFRIPKKK